MASDREEARQKFAEATQSFMRHIDGTVDKLPFPAEWRAGRLLIVKPDLRKLEHLEAFTALMNTMIVIDRQLQQRARDYLEEENILGLLRETQPTRDRNAFSADFVDLAMLYRLAKISGPQNLLELGSGLSTVVLGHAAEQTGGQLVCLEPNAEWAAHTLDHLPTSLRPHVSIFHAPAKRIVLGATETSVFDFHPKQIPDFIYVDGAPKGSVFAGFETVVRLEPELSPGTVIVIDGRRGAVAALLGMTNMGTVDPDMRLVQRNYDVQARGAWVRMQETDIAAGPWLGFDRFCLTMALLTD